MTKPLFDSLETSQCRAFDYIKIEQIGCLFSYAKRTDFAFKKEIN